jgi:hypothetical protein
MTTRRRTLAVAAATTLLAGLGAYGATTAFAAPSHPSSRSAATATATVSPAADGKNTDTMIRQCVSHLPAKDRAAVKKQMREMMSGHDSTSMNGMMGSASPSSPSGMMRDTP